VTEPAIPLDHGISSFSKQKRRGQPFCRGHFKLLRREKMPSQSAPAPRRGASVRFAQSRALTAAVLASTAVFAASAQTRAAVWYVPGTGGTNPNLPDFYQHQDYTNGGNGWEPRGGWCEYTAYSDAFYDLSTQGYQNLFVTNPTTNPWWTSMYGPNLTVAGVQQSNIYNLVTAMGALGNTWQAYLNLTANKAANVQAGTMPALLSQADPTNSAGTVFYYSATGRLLSTNQNVYNFTNNLLQNTNSEVLYRLRSGTASLAANANGQRLWWGGTGGGSFHYVTVGGIDTVNNIVSIADPDTNFGSTSAAGGWPGGAQAAAIGFPFRTPNGAAIPVAANANPITNDFAGFTFNGRTISSADAPQYKNTYVQTVNMVMPVWVTRTRAGIVTKPAIATPSAALTATAGLTVKSAIAPTEEETDITITLPTSSDAVDEVYVEPSNQVDNPAVDPTLFSFTDDSDTAASWTDSENNIDPFGNTTDDGGIEYNLTGGNPLEPGETADLNIATASDFTTTGYDVLLHFAGEPSSEWVPESIGGSAFDPEDTASEQTVVPEPASAALLAAGTLSLLTRRRRRSI
jgi:hypothetical protein